MPLIVLAKAASRPLATFLTAYVAYRVLDLLWLCIFLILSLREGGTTQIENFFRPIRLIRQLRRDRHFPASEDDVSALRVSGEAVGEMWDRVFWFYVWIALVNIAFGGVLILLMTLWDSMGGLLAALWLMNVLATHLTLQRCLPQFYGL